MEFPSNWYFSFWSLISIIFSALAISALQNTPIPFPDILGYFFLVSVSCSISYALLFRPALEFDQLLGLQDPPSTWFIHFLIMYPSLITVASNAYSTLSGDRWNSLGAICVLVGTVIYALDPIILVYKASQITGNYFTGLLAGPLRMYPYQTFCWVLLQGFFLLSNSQVNANLFPRDVLHISLLSMSISFPAISYLGATARFPAFVYKERRYIEIACGMLANTLAQYYFRLQTLPLLLAFWSLSMAWLGIIANVQPSTDFGIFQFFVTMGLQSAVTLFGLHLYTFLLVFLGIALVILRWKMESVSLKHFHKQETAVRDWKRFEQSLGIIRQRQPGSSLPLSVE